ncbi:MAG: hypothetical protein ACOY45_13130 [Pseudomonadota bacterium]
MPDAVLRSRARLAMWLVTVPLAALLLLTLLLVGNIVWQGGRFAEPVAIYYLPMAFYIWAIWMVRQALRAVAGGALFDQVVPTLLGRIGIALFAGALFKEFGVPLFSWLAYGRAWFQTFEASGVTLGVVGLSLILFAQLLARASGMRDELEEFF